MTLKIEELDPLEFQGRTWRRYYKLLRSGNVASENWECGKFRVYSPFDGRYFAYVDDQEVWTDKGKRYYGRALEWFTKTRGTRFRKLETALMACIAATTQVE